MEVRKVASKESGVRSKERVGRIGVLMGGPSTEREISLKSGKAVYEALQQLNIEAIAIDIKTDNIEENIHLIKSYNIDCAFIALHGRFGEDGQLQEILDNIKIPYTGSGAPASRLAIDKVASRRIFEEHGLAVPKYKVVEKLNYTNKGFRNDIMFPLVIKPATHGSSIGLSIIDEAGDLAAAMELAFGFDEKIIIEEYIRGREVTVGILNKEALPVIELIPKKRFFDYEAKYQPGMTEYIVPAKLEAEISRKIQSSAMSAHKLLGCSGFSRVDMILSENNIPFVLELNSIPGLTPASLLPKAAETVGIEFGQLCLRLIKLAYEKAQDKFNLTLHKGEAFSG